MFTNFFLELRQAKVPVSIKEYLALMEGMDKHVADYSVDDFYYLSRTILVKDERNLDKFDKVFGHVFKGLEALACGVPVAAYPVTGPLDVIANNPVGVLNEDLRVACLEALNISRTACRDYALTRSWETSAKQFMTHLRRISKRAREVQAA